MLAPLAVDRWLAVQSDFRGHDESIISFFRNRMKYLMRWNEDHESNVAKVEKPLKTTREVVVNSVKRLGNTPKMNRNL